jgi:hypothetical protein
VGLGILSLARVDDFSRGEYPVLREMQAGVFVSRACLRQEAFHQQAQEVRRETTRRSLFERAACLATRYGQRGSPGHRVMANVLAAAAYVPNVGAEVANAIEIMWAGAAHVDPAARRNRPGVATVARWERGAELIARRGAGLCLAPGCDGERDRAITCGGPRQWFERAGRQYCEKHFDLRTNKSDARMIEETYSAAAAALPELGDLLYVLAAIQRTRAA